MERNNIKELLDWIDPRGLSYQEWVDVGMALEHEGYDVSVWDAWSQKDAARYHQGECQHKWKSFAGSGITGGTIVHMAQEAGWSPVQGGHELDWDDEISRDIDDDYKIVDASWIENREIAEPRDDWQPHEDLIKYLEALFSKEEIVGYVVESFDSEDGRKIPGGRGSYTRTAGELIADLKKHGNDLGAALGDYRPEAGAWVRFNPLDGKGVKNENVTEYRYALVESDEADLSKQNALIRELELPVAALVYSGSKSLHAIVKVEAGSLEEYKKRVEYLYKICDKNGLKVDRQNKNPSRLSRLPGAVRGEHKQFLVATNIGKEDWETWEEWIEETNDNLPDPESLSDVWDNLPELSEPLIENVLRKGHKMLITGPSKAGKSFLIIELCIAIAEGKKWIGWDCKQGKVLYVNLELDRASGLHRFKDAYKALGIEPRNIDNIEIWNLRGKSVPMDKLAPKLIRRAAKKNYTAVVIDPIYKVITGDENSADQMANFCNQFDKICTELNCSVIYCHHHSKGSQGAKRSMDRASGSGVFARDPDALLDMIQLPVSEDLLAQEINKAVCEECLNAIRRKNRIFEEEISQDDMCSQSQMLLHAQHFLSTTEMLSLNTVIHHVKEKVAARTAWRIEGTLREFASFKPVSIWFDYPRHVVDNVGSLQDVNPEEEQPAWKRAMDKRKPKAQKAKDRKKALEAAVESGNFGEAPTLDDIADYLGISTRSARDRVKEHGGYEIVNGEVRKKT